MHLLNPYSNTYQTAVFLDSNQGDLFLIQNLQRQDFAVAAVLDLGHTKIWSDIGLSMGRIQNEMKNLSAKILFLTLQG